jgi:multicomponent Na+:H+ antiporter subunit E
MRSIGRLTLLTALWLLAWGQVSLANVVSGVVVAVALLAAFPQPIAGSADVRINLLAALRLVGFVAGQIVTSNVIMTREILRRRSTMQPGVLAHRLQQPSEHLVTVMTSVISLSPGTLTVDVDRASSTIYVHFIFLHDVRASHAVLERLERMAARAITADRHDPQSGVT